VTTDTSCDTSSTHECDVSATKGLQPIAGSCGAISTAATEEMPKHVGERSAMKQQAAPEASKRKEISRNLQTSLLMASSQALPPEYNLPAKSGANLPPEATYDQNSPTCPHCPGPIQCKALRRRAPRHSFVGTVHPMSAASFRPRSAADCLMRSSFDISHPRQQGNPPACQLSCLQQHHQWPWCRCSRGGWQFFTVF